MRGSISVTRRPLTLMYPRLMTERAFFRAMGESDVDALWTSLSQQPFFVNPSAYAAPEAGRWGTAGRNSITGPRQFAFDAGIGRSFLWGDRLTLDWNKRTVARFKDKLAQDGVHAFLVRNPLNTTYLTGYWHTTTERPEATFMNHDDADPWFMYPALDRDLVRTWWFGSGKTYFDFKDAGSFPNEGSVVQGKTVDLFRFLLEGIKEHGIQGKKIGIDGELYPSESANAREILPDIEWVNVDPMLMDMRIVKTPEELALWRRAYVYFDRAHAFARDYILTHGTDITDYEVAMATQFWINQQLYSDLKLANGTPHHGVKSGVDVEVRAGDVVLLRTGWARYWEDAALFIAQVHAPGPGEPAARWISSARIMGISGSEPAASTRRLCHRVPVG